MWTLGGSWPLMLDLVGVVAGLPAVLPALPLELTVLCNTLLFDIAQSSDSSKTLLALIDYGLNRGKACISLCLKNRILAVWQDGAVEKLARRPSGRGDVFPSGFQRSMCWSITLLHPPLP